MASAIHKVIVIGSTGATGKHVVDFFLDRGDTKVVAIARSKEKLIGLLTHKGENRNLIVKEASIVDLTVNELKDLSEGCTAIVCCLGHNLTFKGIFNEGYFVSETVKKIATTMPRKGCRFILMGSDGVAHPDGVTDPKRSTFELFILWLLRCLVPPAYDNELAASYLYNETISCPKFVDWSIVRPGDLIDKDATKILPYNEQNSDDYKIFDHPFGFLFGDNSVARYDVAHFMVNLSTMDENNFQNNFNHKMPAIYGKEKASSTEKDKKMK